jgi:hypothetical protein
MECPDVETMVHELLEIASISGRRAAEWAGVAKTRADENEKLRTRLAELEATLAQRKPATTAKTKA